MSVESEGYTVRIKCDADACQSKNWPSDQYHGENKRQAWEALRSDEWLISSDGSVTCWACQQKARRADQPH